MLNRNINSILYQSYKKIGELSNKIAINSKAGLDGTKTQEKLWETAIRVNDYLFTIADFIEIKNNTVYREVGITDVEINKLLSCLEQLVGIHDYPIAPYLVTKDVTKLGVFNEGVVGIPGTNGASAYMAIAFASDNIGTDFSSTPSPLRPYVAFKASNALIPFVPSSFTGLWVKFIGDPGEDGDPGNDGLTFYPYIRYASDTSGTDFSATPSATRKYIGYIISSTNHLNNPPSSLFNGVWTKYIGENGQAGTNGQNGKTILIVSGSPDNAIGTDGDIALDPVSSTLYAPKANSIWPAGISLIGPQGPQGTAGNNGINGTNGANAYFYIAWADDASGTGFTTTFDPNKEWIATISSATEIVSPTVANFSGRWSRYRGDGDRWKTTSITSLTIGTGTKAFIVGTGLAYSTGQKFVIAVDNDPGNRMEGLVISYDQATGQFTGDITDAFGSGTFSSWDVNLQGAPSAVVTSDSFFAEIFTDSNSGGTPQALTTSFVKLNQFLTIGDVSGGMAASAINDNITPGAVGEFNIYVDLMLSSLAGGSFEIQLFKDGVAVLGTKRRFILAAANVPANLSLETLKAVIPGQVYEIRVRATTGTPDILLEEGTFGMFTTGTPATPEYTKFGGTNFDTGTGIVIDAFATSSGNAVIWAYKILKGNNVRTGTIQACWDTIGNINKDIGSTLHLGTIGITLDVDINGGNVRLLADIVSDDWEVSGNRYIL